MATLVALLRGVNLGARNRLSMPELRSALTEAGYQRVRTLLQSGNVLLESELAPEELAKTLSELIESRFDTSVPVLVRSRGELQHVAERNPLADVATDPKRYQVTFLSEPLPDEAVERLQALTAADERFVAEGRELYAWHPEGIGRSKLASALPRLGDRAGVVATARNWSTVLALLEMADAA